MNRRSFLRRSGAVGALVLAGCTDGENPESGNGNDGGSATDTPTETATPTPTPTLSVTDASVETVRTTCASGGVPSAEVSVLENEDRIDFAGRLHAPTPCHEVVVESATYDVDDDTLRILLGTKSDDDGVCVECVGLLVFEGSVSVAGGVPGDVTVIRDDAILGSTKDGVETPTPGPTPALENHSFEVTDVGPGAESGEADIEFDTDSNTVVVTGTINGKNGCMTAELGSADYDAATDTLSVDVVTTRREGTEDQACTQQIVGVDYRARFEFDGGVPKAATISHDGQGLGSAAHGSASASPADDEATPADDD